MPVLALACVPLLALSAILAGEPEIPALEQEKPAVLAHADEAVDRMLDELERSDVGMRDLRARIVYDRIDAILGDRQYRFGELLFRDRTPEGQANRAGMRSFVVNFNTYADENVRRDLNESWAFDGRWLIERNDDDKTYRKREITRAGEEVDPLRLGEGPLPIPIGQRKADILARFEVELVEPMQGIGAPEDPADDDPARSYREAVAQMNAVQLKLTPRQKQDGDFDHIRLWYWKATDDSDRWVPLLVRAVKMNARGREVDVAYVLMGGVKINQGLGDDRMIVPEPGPRDGYTVQVDRLPAREVGQ